MILTHTHPGRHTGPHPWTGAWCATVSATGLHRWSSEGGFRFTLGVCAPAAIPETKFCHCWEVKVSDEIIDNYSYSYYIWNIIFAWDQHPFAKHCDVYPQHQGFGPILAFTICFFRRANLRRQRCPRTSRASHGPRSCRWSASSPCWRRQKGSPPWRTGSIWAAVDGYLLWWLSVMVPGVG